MKRSVCYLGLVFLLLFPKHLEAGSCAELMSTPQALLITGLVGLTVTQAFGALWAVGYNTHWPDKISAEKSAKIQEAMGLANSVSGWFFGTLALIVAYRYSIKEQPASAPPLPKFEL